MANKVTTKAQSVSGLLNYRGSYDASVNSYPATGGSGTAGVILKGDSWTISVAGTLGGVAVVPGDLLISQVNTPGQTASNWDIIETASALSNYVPYTGATQNVDLGLHNLTVDTNTLSALTALASSFDKGMSENERA